MQTNRSRDNKSQRVVTFKVDEIFSNPSSPSSDAKKETILDDFSSDPCQSSTSKYLQSLFYKSGKNLFSDEACRRRGRDVAIFMHEMWLQQSMCDIMIKCSDGSLMAHQAVLGTYSKMLSSHFVKHAVQQIAEIHLKEVSRKITAEVLNFLYTTDLRLNCKIIQQVIHCAKSLDLPIILDVCEDYLIQSADPDNILIHYSTAYNSSLDDTKERLLSVIAQSFDEIRTHPHYPLLTKEKLLEILHHPLLINDEADMFVGVLQWVEHLKDERIPVAHELLKNINMKKIDLKTMVQLLDEYDWITIDPDCNELVVDFYRHHALLKAINKSEVKISKSNANDNLDIIQKDNTMKLIFPAMTENLNDFLLPNKNEDIIDKAKNNATVDDGIISKFEPELSSTPRINRGSNSKMTDKISLNKYHGSEVRNAQSINKFQQGPLNVTEKQELPKTHDECKSKYRCEDDNIKPYFK